MPPRSRRPFRPSQPRFQRTAEIAETATGGVAAHMRNGDILIAMPLQSVARAAWGAAADPSTLPELRQAVRDALDALDQVAGAAGARRFLLHVDEHLETEPAGSERAGEPPLSLF